MRYSRWDVSEHHGLNPDMLGDEWHRVTDTDGTAGTFYIRVGPGPAGGMVITGLVLGDGVAAITADTLRALKPAEIIRTIQWRESGSPPPHSVGDVSPLTGLARFEWMTEAMETSAGVTGAAPPSRRGPKPPPRDQLERFASVYNEHARWTPKRAIARTIYDLRPMTRATAYRWLERCRQLGLVPKRGEMQMGDADESEVDHGS